MKDIITAAALRASAKAQHARELQGQLQAAKASRDALAAALAIAQTARAEAERHLAERERATGGQLAMLASLALQQSRAIRVRAFKPGMSSAACISGCLLRIPAKHWQHAPEGIS